MRCDRGDYDSGEGKSIKYLSGVTAGEACAIVFHGSTSRMVDKAERSLHDALSVLSLS
ncbi:T-complex protein 1 subunit beta [Ceratobasidium sp. 394]|nr:T-complex protein 1 subunit beta [Ceratobasidium sp. 394]